MRLTNDMRKAFVSAVMADTPKVDYDSMIRKKAMDTAIEVLPRAVRQLWSKPETAGYVETKYVSVRIEKPNSTSVYDVVTMSLPGDNTVDALVKEACADLAKKASEQRATREELQRQLHIAAAHCTTTDELARVMPEFASYVPRDPSKATRSQLAVADLVSQFGRAGWKAPKKAVAA